MSDTKKVKVIGPAIHDGAELKLGQILELEAKVADHLVAQRAAEFVDKPAVKPAAEAAKK